MRIASAPYIVNLNKPEAARKQSGQAQAAAPSQPVAKARSYDRVEISPRARELERLKRDLQALPEVRLDRVALAKQNLQGGGYRVEPTYLAQRIMEAFGK
jgi:negative regulator of flagellin synthesis FlgM